MKYKIPENRIQFLREIFLEYSFKGIDLDTKALDQISESIELDFIAKNHNYDDGNNILLHIINNPNCDFSTAKMIFFRSDLDGFLKTNKKSDDYELISSIIQNCNNEFYKTENFHYNPSEDSEILEFDFDIAKNIFPSALFAKAKGKKIEPDFAENFQKRNISTINEKVSIHKKPDKIVVSNKRLSFEFDFPENFKTIQDNVIEKFIKEYKFPDNLEKTFGISEIQLRRVIIKPELIIEDKNLIIALFVFNSTSLLMKNAVTNVGTIMRNEFVYVQSFFQITGVEENFDKIKRIKYNDNWFALSKGMRIKIENLQNEKYLKLLLVEKDGLLFYSLIISDLIENLDNDIIQNLIINRTRIQQQDFS